MIKLTNIVEGTRCWKGYEKKGTKKLFGKTVPNCVKKEEISIDLNESVIRILHVIKYDISSM